LTKVRELTKNPLEEYQICRTYRESHGAIYTSEHPLSITFLNFIEKSENYKFMGLC
jgi:hypothetical protein